MTSLIGGRSWVGGLTTWAMLMASMAPSIAIAKGDPASASTSAAATPPGERGEATATSDVQMSNGVADVDDPVGAAEPSVDDLLINAERLLERGKPRLAVDQLTIVLDEGGLDVDTAARASLLLGRALFQLDDLVGAAAAFRRAAVCQKTLPAHVKGAERLVFDDAQGDGTLLTVVAARVNTSTPGVTVVVEKDPFAMVHGVRVVVSNPATGDATSTTNETELRLDVGHPVVFFAAANGAIVDVTVIDARGNAIVTVPVGDAPSATTAATKPNETTTTAAATGPSFSDRVVGAPWVTVGAAAVIALAVVGMATTGTLVAIADEGSETITPDLKSPLLAGMAACAALVVAGGAVIVVDRVIVPFAKALTQETSPPDLNPSGVDGETHAPNDTDAAVGDGKASEKSAD